jgi:hypothetical protein
MGWSRRRGLAGPSMEPLLGGTLSGRMRRRGSVVGPHVSSLAHDPAASELMVST